MGKRLPRANTQFGKLTNADLVTYGQAVVNGLTASTVSFPAPPVTVVTLQGYVNDYSTALAASIGGSLQQRADMRTKRNILRSGLRQNALYVNQGASGLVAGGSSYESVSEIITMTGYQLGLNPSPAGPLPEPEIIKFSSPRRGVLYILLPRISNAKGYVVQYGLLGTSPSTWVTETFPNTRINVTGLTSGVTYQFRCYYRGANTTINLSVTNSQVII